MLVEPIFVASGAVAVGGLLQRIAREYAKFRGESAAEADSVLASGGLALLTRKHSRGADEPHDADARASSR